jgi:hypothetical protein
MWVAGKFSAVLCIAATRLSAAHASMPGCALGCEPALVQETSQVRFQFRHAPVPLSSGHRRENGPNDKVHGLVVDRLPGEPAAVEQRPEESGDDSAEVS